MTYLFVKTLHIAAAVLTLSGFVLRGYWMMKKSVNLQHRVVRIAPHIVDTVFLMTAIALLVQLNLNVLAESWLVAKLTGLVAYIVLGTIALRRGSTLKIRKYAFVAALAVFAYIVGVAINKSPASWL